MKNIEVKNMTNGEKIIAVLNPRTNQIKILGNWVEIEIQKLDINFSCSLDWWNAEYKEPTAKNDLAVDCISREATVKRLCNLAEFMNEHKENSGAPYIVAALFIQDNKTEFPSVTPQEPRIDFEELKRKILMEVDDGTDDAWLAYGEVCNRISNAIDEFVADMRGEET